MPAGQFQAVNVGRTVQFACCTVTWYNAQEEDV